MNIDDIKRATELWFCKKLRAATGGRWFSSKGGEYGVFGAGVITPPFGFVQVTEAATKLPGGAAWLLTVKVAYLTHLGDTGTPAHSAAVRQLTGALHALAPGVDAELGVAVSGTDVAATDDFTDDEEQTHGDVFTVTAGVSQ